MKVVRKLRAKAMESDADSDDDFGPDWDELETITKFDGGLRFSGTIDKFETNVSFCIFQ